MNPPPLLTFNYGRDILFFLNVGYCAPFFQKLTNAVCRWRRDCWTGTQLTSLSQATSGVAFSFVSAADVAL